MFLFHQTATSNSMPLPTEYNPMVRNKDFEVIAHAFRDCKPKISDFGTCNTDFGIAKLMWQITIETVAKGLKADNANFDTKRFYVACGYCR